MTISENRAIANRTNARKSTGPRTTAGLAKAAKNALSHGLAAATPVLPGERAEDWDRHRAGITAALAPVGTMEEALADRVADCLWRLRRVVAYETAATLAGVEEAVTDPPPVDLGSSAERDLKRRAKTRKELDEIEHKLDTSNQAIRYWETFPEMGDESPIPHEIARLLAEDLATALPDEADFDPDHPTFLIAAGVPETYLDEPYLWSKWTAGAVRRYAAALAAKAGVDATALLSAGVEARRDEIRETTEAEDRIATELREVEDRVAARTRRAVLRRILPDIFTVEKVVRYEGHLTRQMTTALHTLERLQAARSGAPVPPPAAIDVTVTGPG
jgi:hypothetical protein